MHQALHPKTQKRKRHQNPETLKAVALKPRNLKAHATTDEAPKPETPKNLMAFPLMVLRHQGPKDL